MSAPDRFTRYVVFLHQIDGVATGRDHIAAHVTHLRQLARAGHLVLCGPFADAPGGGMVILQARDLDEAHRLAQADPFVRLGLRRYELRTWHLSNEDNNHMGMG